ncbi:D123-domain-containing protein [Dipodascopsis uninucleata]
MPLAGQANESSIAPSLETEQLLPSQAFPPVSVQHIRNCSYSSWHAKYKNHTPRSKILRPVEKGFMDYLLSDGIFLPPEGETAEWSDSDDDDQIKRIEEDLNALSTKSEGENGNEQSRGTGESKEPDDEEDDDEDHLSTAEIDPSTVFQELDRQIKDILDEYGAVTPKLNWSSPRDATWITTTNSLKCVTAGDIYLILKSSDFIIHDLLYPFEDCTDTDEQAPEQAPEQANSSLPLQEIELILRKWVNFNPSMEFRCFVRNRELIAISQRSEHFYDFLEPLKETLSCLIEDFFADVLQDTFPDPNFCFDVYIPKPEDKKVWLVDINPFAPRTDTLLFSWYELLNLDDIASSSASPIESPEFRLVSESEGIHSFSRKPFSSNMVPRDVVDASIQGGGAGIASFAKQWREMLEKQGGDSSSDRAETSKS